jgi:hypothetical protein
MKMKIDVMHILFYGNYFDSMIDLYFIQLYWSMSPI